MTKIKQIVRNILMLMFAVFAASNIYAQQEISGTIYEELNGVKQPLPFANVFIPGTTRGATSDFDGKYTVTVYENDTLIKVSYMGYNDVLKSFNVADGELIVDVVMSSSDAALQLDGVTVTAKKNLASENMLLLEQKKAVVVRESIGSTQLSNLGISDAAAAATKISGVNKTEGSGDIYIRGLGDRYLTTTMNDLPIPSDDVEKKNIDLNLFPADVIKNVSISKTYGSDRYADQTSGQVDIASKTYSKNIAIGLSTGANSNVFPVADEFKASQNYVDQTWGFYSNPSSDLEQAVKTQSWNTVDKKVPFKYGFSLMGGKMWEGETHELTLFATLSSGANSEYQEGIYKKYRSNVLKESYSDVTTYATSYNTTALLNLAYEKSQKLQLNFNSIWVVKTKDVLYEAGRNGEGYFYEQQPEEEGAFIRDQNIKQTQLFINQFIGSYAFANNDLKWAVAYNSVSADEPNRIRNQINIPTDENHLDAVKFAYNGNYDQRKSMQKINDNELNAYLKDQHHFLDEEQRKLSLNTGLNYRGKTRNFIANAVGVRAKDASALAFDDLSEVFNNSSLYGRQLQIKDREADTYDARLNVYSAFANVNFQYNRISGNIGARYEYDNIYVDWDVQNAMADDEEKSYTNLLPSLNAKYNISDKNLIRVAASKTITLPEFKELAPFEYVSPNGSVTKGNPQLESSESYNFDLKWEMYMRPKELLSLTAFSKQIYNPINRALTRGSSGYYYYANTGKRADVYGLELEGRVNIISAMDENKPSLRLSFNLTKMWAEQDLIEEFQYNNKTRSGLQGAADFIANGSLIFSDHKENEFMATLSLNYSSDKIFSLGAPEDNESSDVLFNSEVVEKGFTALDLVLKKKFSNRISAKITAKNLLNPTIEWKQDVLDTNGVSAQVVESYNKGIQINAGLTININ